MAGANWPDEPVIGSLFRLIWRPGVMLRTVLARFVALHEPGQSRLSA
jgi:hypothetical protein